MNDACHLILDTNKSTMPALSRQVNPCLRRLLLAALLPAMLGGCGGNIHKKNLSNDFLIQGAALALNVAPEAITLSNRHGQGPTSIGFDITVTGDTQRYHCSIFTRGHLGWSLWPVGCGCYRQSDDGIRWIGPCPAKQTIDESPLTTP